MRQRQPSTITGIDIGSHAIRVAVGSVEGEGRAARIHIIGAAELAAEGVERGVVTSIEDAVSSLSGILEQIEREVGIPVENAWVGLGGAHIIVQQSRGVVAVAKSDGEIAQDDVARAVEAARMVAPPLNFEMLHILPKGFGVDGQSGIKDPVGMTGIRLEVDTQIIHGQTTHLKNIEKTVYRTGIGIDDLVLSILATGDVVTTDKQRQIGVGVVNIGEATTSLIVFEDGEVIHITSLPIGSSHITNDLAIGLRTSIDVAERVKIQYGHCLANKIAKKEKINLAELGADSSEMVDRQFCAEIIEARATELLEKVHEELRRVNKSALLPAGIVFTGGGAKITGLTDLGKQVLELPCSLGYAIDIVSSSPRATDLSFTTAVGLVKWGASLEPRHGKVQRRAVVSKKITEHLGKFLKSLIP